MSNRVNCQKSPRPAEGALFLLIFIFIFLPAGGRNRLGGGRAGGDLKEEEDDEDEEEECQRASPGAFGSSTALFLVIFIFPFIPAGGRNWLVEGALGVT